MPPHREDQAVRAQACVEVPPLRRTRPELGRRTAAEGPPHDTGPDRRPGRTRRSATTRVTALQLRAVSRVVRELAKPAVARQGVSPIRLCVLKALGVPKSPLLFRLVGRYFLEALFFATPVERGSSCECSVIPSFAYEVSCRMSGFTADLVGESRLKLF